MGTSNFVDIYCSIKGTNINARVFENLVKIGYFKAFGSIKKLLEAVKIVDMWKGSSWEGKKTISKSKISELGLDGINVRKYATDIKKSGKVSDKRFTNVDWKGIARELVDSLPNDEYGVLQLVKFQYEVLNYVDYVDETVEWRYVAVTDLNTSYSPKFNAYSINNGKSVEMKVHRKKPKMDKLLIHLLKYHLKMETFCI